MTEQPTYRGLFLQDRDCVMTPIQTGAPISKMPGYPLR